MKKYLPTRNALQRLRARVRQLRPVLQPPECTEINFAAFGMVGMRFCPRISSLHRQRDLLRRPGPRPRRPRACSQARPAGGELPHRRAVGPHRPVLRGVPRGGTPRRRSSVDGSDLPVGGRELLNLILIGPHRDRKELPLCPHLLHELAGHRTASPAEDRDHFSAGVKRNPFGHRLSG